MTVSGSTVTDNAAVGGFGNSGSGAVVLVGEGLGGGIVSGYGSSVYGVDTLTVTGSSITQQHAADGGNNNSGTLSNVRGVGRLRRAGAGCASPITRAASRRRQR